MNSAKGPNITEADSLRGRGVMVSWPQVLRALMFSMITTNRIISSQALIIIRFKRNKFIIRSQKKLKSSRNLVAKFKNFTVNLLLWRVVTTVSLYRLADSPGKRI